MTTYLITEAQRDQAMKAFQIATTHFANDRNKIAKAFTMLQSLLMVDSEPYAWMNPDDLCADTAFRWCKLDEFTSPVFTSPQTLTPEDDCSDWFYKLQFICRVLEGNPPEQDKATALGMARSLKRERWTAEKALTPITGDRITELEAQLADAKKDAERYQWLCDKGYNYHGAMAGTGSMSICRGPYILLEPPALNKFSNMVLGKPSADVIIDAAIAEGKA